MVTENRRICGFWHNDVLNGHGRIIETRYMCKGEFKNGKREGYCIEKYLNGNSYHGEFLNDERSGEGKYINVANQEEYEGEWKNSKKNGYGKFTY